MPTIPEMLKEKLKVKKLAVVKDGVKTPGGNIAFKDAVEIAKKMPGNLKSNTKMVLGTCLSCGVTVDNRNPKEIQKEIDEGLIELK